MAFVRDLDNLIPIMTSNSAPSGYVASANSYFNPYAPWYAFNGVHAVADLWQLYPFTNPAWISIQLPASKAVNKYTICPHYNNGIGRSPKSWKFQGSINGSTWVDLDTQTNYTAWDIVGANKSTFIFSNSTPYSYYRVYITSVGNDGSDLEISELELCATGQYASLIPVMTANNAPSGVASASREANAQSMAYGAMNGTDTTEMLWQASNATQGWLRYQFAVAKVVKQYSLLPFIGYENRSPSTWTFQGSNDGTDWTTLDTQTNVSGWLSKTAKTFSITNANSYLYYQINVTANNGGTILSISELRMFGTGEPVSANIIRPQIIGRL